MTSFSTVHDIFHSGTHSFRGSPEAINLITFLINEDYLNTDTVIIGNKIEYQQAIEDIIHKSADTFDSAGGSTEHIALKHLAAEYLKSRQNFSVQYEQLYCGYYPDVLTKDRAVIVECGHTQNPEKILSYLQSRKTQECIQVPYPDVDDTNIVGFKFLPGKDLREFLDFLAQKERETLKTLITKKG